MIPSADLSTLHSSPLPLAGGGGAITFRPLVSVAEFQACVALQHATWGEDGETVPVSLLRATSHVGGLAIGAFASDGTLLGFVFGLAGVEHGEVVHWSHMLAVREAARGAGIGRTLKEEQRAELARRGVDRIYWTFDPLQARNAHLNIVRLGARVVDYVEDMYGITRSPLHLGMSTDRLVALSSAADRPRSSTEAAARAAQLAAMPSAPAPADLAVASDGVLIEAPWDIQAILAASPEDAAGWRRTTRARFQLAFRHGYTVSGFHRDAATRRAYYVLDRAASAR